MGVVLLVALGIIAGIMSLAFSSQITSGVVLAIWGGTFILSAELLLINEKLAKFENWRQSMAESILFELRLPNALNKGRKGGSASE